MLDLETSGTAQKIITAECRRAVAEDEADAIVLGCAGMARLCADISAELGVPVVDGVAAAALFVQAPVTMKLAGAARGEFAPPPRKAYTGLLASFTRPAADA